MKNWLKVLGIIAMVAVIGFSMAACGEEEEEGGGSATVIFKNSNTETANYVGITDGFNNVLEDEAANIAPGAEKSYKISPNKDRGYGFMMGKSSNDFTIQTYGKLESGKTYTATWAVGNYAEEITVTVK